MSQKTLRRFIPAVLFRPFCCCVCSEMSQLVEISREWNAKLILFGHYVKCKGSAVRLQRRIGHVTPICHHRYNKIQTSSRTILFLVTVSCLCAIEFVTNFSLSLNVDRYQVT